MNIVHCGSSRCHDVGLLLSCNVFDSGFFPKHIPSFSWGAPDNLVPYRMDKAVEHSNKMMERRNTKLEKEDLDILKAIKN